MTLMVELGWGVLGGMLGMTLWLAGPWSMVSVLGGVLGGGIRGE